MVASFVRKEPVTVSGVVTVVLGWLGQLGVPAAIVAGVGTIVGLLIATLVRGGVTTVASAAQTATTAAVEAATEVAEKIDAVTAGVSGTATSAAEGLIQEAVANATGALLVKSAKHK